MDSTTERMPIACVHCAKAKAKCDKKVPCTRCVGKQITCQSRATRRSSQHPSRRNNTSKIHPDRHLQTSTIFHLAKPSRAQSQQQMDQRMLCPNGIESVIRYSQHDDSSINQIPQPIQMAPLIHHSETDIQILRNSLGNTPPELSLPITPMMQDVPHIDAFLSVDGMSYDIEADMQFFNVTDPANSGMLELQSPIAFGDFFSTGASFRGPEDLYMGDDKAAFPPPSNSMSMLLPEACTLNNEYDFGCLTQSMPFTSGMSPHQTAASYIMRPLQESDAITLSQPFWPMFQCNQLEAFPIAPPKTAGIYLEGLAQTLREQITWQAWSVLHLDSTPSCPEQQHITVEPIVDWPREKLLAITQAFLLKALDIHRADQNIKDEAHPSPASGNEAFLMLPPPQVMQHFLERYVTRYEAYYPSIPAGKFNPNSLMHCQNSKAGALLILLMAASGASAIPAIEARYLASGLTEACRLSLFDAIEKDVLQAREPLILRSALLFTCLAAWSGDKWHMDMAMGQRGMYLAMLCHSGILSPSGSYLEIGSCKATPDRAWEDWKEHEGQHRLAHAWIVLDQEISLFSDTSPLLSIVDLHTPIADVDLLWHAESSTEWLEYFEQIHASAYKSSPSVRDLFSKFVDGDLNDKSLSPTNIRLLLHPLQAQICQLRHFMTCLPHSSAQQASNIPSRAATKARLEELSMLLKSWYAISRNGVSSCRGPCWTTYANLVMYHLISLNTITSFKCIEQFARKEININPSRFRTWLQTRCVDQTEESYFHCGQVLRLLQSLPTDVRPPWWAGAVYRVALTAWATSSAANGPYIDVSELNMVSGPQFAIDRLLPEHETISRYVQFQEGTPMLTDCGGQLVPLANPTAVLIHCADLLAGDLSMRLTDAIQRKLYLLAECWKYEI